MDIILYTKTRCPYCISAKTWLNQRNYTFEEVNLDNEVLKEAFVKEHPTLRTVPQIFVDGEHIGGFSDLVKSRLA